MSRGLRIFGGPALALAVWSAPWAGSAAAQQAPDQQVPELRPALVPLATDPLTPDPLLQDVNVSTDASTNADTNANNLAPQPQVSRLTVSPEPPPPPPPPRRRGIEADPNAPMGLRMGAFDLYPVLGIGGAYTDNVAESATKRKADYGLRVAPDLRIQSDWVRHSLSLTAAGDFIFYKKHPEYNDTTFDTQAALRLDVLHDTTFDLTAGYDLTQTFGSSSEVPNTATSQRVDQTVSAAASLTRQAGRLAATLAAEANWYDYGNVNLGGGSIENNADRNYVAPDVRLRLGYAASPALVPFVEAAYVPRLHEIKVDRSGLRRDSQGGYLRAGLSLNPSDLWSGDVAVRYDYRNYADNSLKAVSAVGLDADLIWRPTQLTTVTFKASSGIDETALAGATAIRNWTGSASIAQALRDDVVLTAGIGANYASYVGVSLNELTLSADVALNYILRRNVELTAGYHLTDFRTDTPGGNYVENRITAGVRFRM